jgi:hypothetical protein
MDKNSLQNGGQGDLPLDDLQSDELAALDDLFALARGTGGADDAFQPSMGLMDRVMSDALAAQAVPQVPAAEVIAPRAPHPLQPAFWRNALAALGGWPAMAGLVSASVAGIWIGMNPPSLLSDSAATVLALDSDDYLVDVLPGFSAEIDSTFFEG